MEMALFTRLHGNPLAARAGCACAGAFTVKFQRKLLSPEPDLRHRPAAIGIDVDQSIVVGSSNLHLHHVCICGKKLFAALHNA